MRPIKVLGLSIFIITGLLNVAFSQTAPGALQFKLRHAIDKVFAATVKISEFDTLRSRRTGGSFSGVVVNSEGIILTAAHAMKPKQIYLISFPDGSTTTAEGLGRISHLDAGTLKIREQGSYSFAEMGNDSSPAPGETVVSLGYPSTMNSGITPIARVGAVKKNIINTYIQSSCLMEPGDSGGPLFDLQGKVVGIHSHILGADDENFEIPIAVFRNYWASLLSQGNLSRDDLKTSAASHRTATSENHVDSSFLSVKTQLELKNGNLSNYSYVIQSKLNGENIRTYGILMQLNMEGGKGKHKSYLVSSSRSIGANPEVITKQKQWPGVLIKRDTINDLVLLEVDGLEPNVAGVNINSSPLELMPGSFCLTPVKEKIKVGVIGIKPFHPSANESMDPLPAENVILQDAPLSLEECGGPVFDANQRFIGLNLTRYNRTSVVIIPHATILEFINKLSIDKKPY